MSKRRVVVGMSGGVDSSVTAWLLKEQGYDVVGLFMKNWEDDDDGEYCSTRQDWIDVVSVADLIGIDVEAVNFSAEYKDRVFAEFLREYSAGRTPNPDVLCNAEIKFKAFLDHAMSLDAEMIATGHYARVRERDGRFELLKAFDHTKDQSYFLHRLNQAQLSKTMFPLGEIPKTKVREIAAQIGLPNAKKKDSTGICFIGERPFRDFLNRYLPTKPGPMKTPDGKVVGEHIGLAFYTFGQRKGIGLGGSKSGSGEPWFVAAKDIASNTLYVAQGHDHPWLLSRELVAGNVSWVAGEPPADGFACGAKTRYRQADAACVFGRAATGAEAAGPAGEARFSLAFDDAQWAVTPGQSAVLYDGEICLGGGIIESAATGQPGQATSAGHAPALAEAR
ncbi:tRNA 2-thiouridine(34) synthase MnmA [Burkholderia cenocepacia]|uniref:tRNA-specific 2-thiouridylase MnmA n=3 Tax=Burkholderia cenocepacia TaxID=95486 RepID=A0A1V2W4U0_9BURK|nr:tRNA 2-thiouridine(34) synthase MnmA [Burkholderia cenocepacia]MBR8245783.1 tRNA 2-thiouridine(34) synthase MnmA [Burkholderia cenocepacia]MBR8286068.1 tRNA 2-thiouridine(34) synthase MnmA [Burkholderia cenocepacia]MBR8496123.1 tRNA 2-thiouridine(34) synthase MnmA [Burkholderia cenocepacia]ONJ12863.1 tRNA 2-thiouridine(34) synthase MnmA [Burkholderia cenocepacia]ONJ31037.1 tRNA 2-thiouridine(34) synthase MnmA [Burkholderia cenocepacia]